MSLPPAAGAIDSHHHFWRLGEAHQSWRLPEHAVLERDFLPSDLAPAMSAAGVSATVLVQSADAAEENDLMLDRARAAGFVAGVVAWLPLRDAAAGQSILSRLQGEPIVRGVRCLVGREPLDWLDTPDCRSLLADLAGAGLSWDVVPVTAEQLRAVLRAAERLPDLRVVIDHMGRPPVGSDSIQPWGDLMSGLADAPNVAVKMSVGVDVLTSWPRWDAAGLQRYVDHIAAAFGPDRMMLASNWPVVELRCPYGRAWSDMGACVQRTGIGPAGLAAARAGTAQAWYKLPA